MTSHAVAERFDFADTLAHTKPDAPTLCEPWTAAQLAAHVILRERSLTQAANRLPVDAARRWSNDRIIHYAEECRMTSWCDAFTTGRRGGHLSRCRRWRTESTSWSMSCTMRMPGEPDRSRRPRGT